MESKELKKQPIFVLGCPRSGTTLLASFFSYSSYGVPIETHFITKYYKKLGNYGDLKSKENLVRLLHDIQFERPVMQWKIQIDEGEFYKELEDFSYSEIVNKICMIRSQKKGYESWGDKTPHYICDLDIIYKLFPDSKYIYIVRDGRDVALSFFGRAWAPNNILSCAEYWKRCNAHNTIIDELKNKKQLYFLRYEDLLDNARQIIPDIFKFMDEDYEEDKMKALISKVKRSNSNKWKNVMNDRQIKLFENVASNTLKKFGYETRYEEKDINGFVSAFFRFHNAVLRAKYLFTLNVIDTIKIKYFGKPPFLYGKVDKKRY